MRPGRRVDSTVVLPFRIVFPQRFVRTDLPHAPMTGMSGSQSGTRFVVTQATEPFNSLELCGDRRRPPARLVGAPLAHRLARTWAASGGRGSNLAWRAATRLAGSVPETAVVSLGGGRLELDTRHPAECGFYRGQYEVDEMRLMCTLVPQGGVALDVGANIGLYTLTLAQLVGEGGRVYALEPSPPAVHRLTGATASLPQVSVLTVAVSDAAGTSRLRVAPGDSMHSTLRSRALERTAWEGSVEVETATLDSLSDALGWGGSTS